MNGLFYYQFSFPNHYIRPTDLNPAPNRSGAKSFYPKPRKGLKHKMTLPEILQRYAETTQVKQLISLLKDETLEAPFRGLGVSGLIGSQDAFVAAAVFKQTEFNHLFVMSDVAAAFTSSSDFFTRICNSSYHVAHKLLKCSKVISSVSHAQTCKP